MKQQLRIVCFFGALFVGACNSGTVPGNASASGEPTQADAVQASLLQNKISVKEGKTYTLPIVFSAKKLGDRASNFRISTPDLPKTMKLVNRCSDGIVSHGNGCHILLSYTGTIANNNSGDSTSGNLDGGVFPISYSYLNSFGKPEAGTINIAYQTTRANNLEVHQLMPGIIRARTNRRTPVQLLLATDDGQPVSNVSIKSLERDVDVNLLSTSGGKDGNLYSKVDKSVPLMFTITPSPKTSKGIKKLHFLISYTSNTTKNNTNTYSLTEATGSTSQQDVSLDYDAGDSGAAVIATVNPSNKVETTIGQPLPVTISFAASSSQVSQLAVQAQQFIPQSSKQDWAVTSTTTPCALVTSTTTNCTISATYAPIAPLENGGTIEFPYTYNVGNQQENGYVSIDFTTNSTNSEVVTTSPATLKSTNVGTTSSFNVLLNSNFGELSSVQLTGLSGAGTSGGFTNSLGLTLNSAATCASTPCTFSFSYSPPETSTPLALNNSPVLNYSYVNNQGVTVPASTTLNLNPVYPMIFISSGTFGNFTPFSSNSFSPFELNPTFPYFEIRNALPSLQVVSANYWNSNVFSGVITNNTGLPDENNFGYPNGLPNLPTADTAFTGVVPYSDTSGDYLYISGVYSNLLPGASIDGNSTGSQYGIVYEYPLDEPAGETVSAAMSYVAGNSLLDEFDGVTGLTGAAIGSNPNNPSFGGPYLFLTAEALYSGAIGLSPNSTPSDLSIGSGSSVGICSLSSGLGNCMSSQNAPSTIGYNFYGSYNSNHIGQDVANGTVVWGIIQPTAYAVDNEGNFYVGQNVSSLTVPPIYCPFCDGTSYSNADLIKCTPSVNGTNCVEWYTVSNTEGQSGPWIWTVATDSSYVYYGDLSGRSYRCSLTAAQTCYPLQYTASGGVWAMAADGKGNLFVGDTNGKVYNVAVSNNVQFQTTAGAITTMTYYAPTSTLYIGDFGGNVSACPVNNGQLETCTTVSVNPKVFISNISLMTFN